MKVSKIITPLLVVFVAITVLIFAFKGFLQTKGVNYEVLLLANVFFLIIHLAVIALQKKALKHANPHVFIRSVMTGLIIKMFSTIAAVLAYYAISGEAFSQKSVFVALFIYLFYLSTEVLAMSRINKAHQ